MSHFLLLVSLHDGNLGIVSFFKSSQLLDSFLVNFGSLSAVMFLFNRSVSILELEELSGELLDTLLLGTQLGPFIQLLLLKSCNSDIVLSELLLASGFE